MVGTPTAKERFLDRTEHSAALIVKGAVVKRINDSLKLGIGVVDLPRIVILLDLFYFFNSRAKDVFVLSAGFFANFNVGTVHGSKSDRAVEHKLHITRSARLHACHRDLLGDICCGHDLFGIRNVIVGNENNAKLIVDLGIVVDLIGNGVDKLDNALCVPICGGCLCAEDECGGLKVWLLAFFDAEIIIKDGKSVHQLTLVLVKSLCLHVKNEFGRQLDAFSLENVFRKLLLFQILDLGKSVAYLGIVCILFKLLEAFKVCLPAIADLFGDESGKLGVAECEPTTGRYTVGNVEELFGIHLIPIAEGALLENFGVQRGNTVDLIARINGYVCHMYGLILDQEELTIRKFLFDACLHLGQNSCNFGQQLAYALHIQAFKRLTQNGVVCKVKYGTCKQECLFELQALFHNEANELGNGKHGVCVVELQRDMLIDLFNRKSLLLVLANEVLHRCRCKEIFLAQTQDASLFGRIVGIEGVADAFATYVILCDLIDLHTVKSSKIKAAGLLTLPQAQGVNGLSAVADDGHIVRNCLGGKVGEFYEYAILFPSVAPRVTVSLPIVCVFLLEAVLKALAEQAVAVTNAVAIERNANGGTRFEIAGSKTAKTAITESCVLNILKRCNIDATLCEQCLYLVKLAKVVKVCKNCTADQEFCRKITHSFLRSFFAFLPRIGNFCHGCATNGTIKCEGGCMLHIDTVVGFEQAFNCFDPFVHCFSVPLL